MTELPATVVALLETWLPGNADLDRPRVQLATVDPDGGPDVRTVLLSSWDTRGFTVHTDARSRKVEQLEADPSAAFALLEPDIPRQLVVRGRTERLAGEDLSVAYAARSDFLKQLAWVNTTDLANQPAEVRAAAWAAFEAEHDPSSLTAPDTWTGFRLVPNRITFWESDSGGPSHRTEHRLVDGDWTLHHLPG